MLEKIARLGWVDEPSPCFEFPDPGALGSIVIKRDDLIGVLHGSSKVRRLDFLLAAEPWASAQRWRSVGAIGSGHLVALTAAAERLDRSLDAYMFWEPPSLGVQDNLAFVASGPTKIRYARSRLELALRFPHAVVPALGGRRAAGIAPGACTPIGNVGAVRAGLELAEQIRAGLLAEPDRVYLPLGTGGTAAGLAVGLALAGIHSTVHAVAVLERPFSSRLRMRGLVKGVISALVKAGVPVDSELRPKLVIRRGWVGRSYGRATKASDTATGQLRAAGVPAEPIYSGKAFACLLADAPHISGQDVVFWFTARTDQAAGSSRVPRGAANVSGWRDGLPRRLTADLDARGRARRKLLRAGVGVAATLAIGTRVSGYERPEARWEGDVLSVREGAVLAAAARAMLPAEPGGMLPGSVDPWQVARNADSYIARMPARMRREVRGLFALLDQATLLGGIGSSSTLRDVPALVRLSNPSRFFTAPERSDPYPTQFPHRPAESTLWSRLTFLCPPDLHAIGATSRRAV